MGFLQVASNPALAPFAKFDYIIREIAKAMDLDPEKVTNDMREAAIQAELLKEFRGQQPQEQPQQQPPAGANPLDPTGAGGGNIGTGQVPVPGEQGFTGENQSGQADTGQPQADGQPSAPLQ
jgi:hypothetical protein